MNPPTSMLPGRGRASCALVLTCLITACSPSLDEQSAIGPEGGSLGRDCVIHFSEGDLNSSVTFAVKEYSDALDMPRDTAPRFPPELEPHLLGGGCFFSPTTPPYRDAAKSAYLRVPTGPIPENRRSLYGDWSDSPLMAFFRAYPFGSWELVADLDSDIVGPFFQSYGYFNSRELGYFAPVAALRFSPHVAGSTTIDEGAPIPLAFGLSGLYAPTADVELVCYYFARSDRNGPAVEGPLDCGLARSQEPGMRYVGEASWNPALSGTFHYLAVVVEARPRSLPPALQAVYDSSRQAHYYAPGSSTVLTVVSSAPRIDTAPASVTVAEGQTATFTVAASGSRPLTYQWQSNGADIPGATGVSYTTPATTAADDGAQFRVVVTNARGTTTTAAATLTVLPASAAPAIARGPLPIAVSAGQPASFDVVATGAAPLAYQWLRDGTPIPGATASSYTLPTATLADDGALFAVRVSNAVNAAGVTSAAARLTVTASGLARGAGEIVSVRQDGTLGAADSSFGDQIAVSGDGRYVAFQSSAPLAGGTACGLFLRDMQARVTQLITLRPDGMPSEVPDGVSCLDGRLAMTPDARFIAFGSGRTDLVDRSFGPGVLNRIYVRDTCIGAAPGCTPRTTLVSVDDNDVALTTGSDYPSISDNGRYVAFLGRAPNQTAFTNAAVIHDRDADGNGVYDERPATPNPPGFRSFAVSRRSDGNLFQGAFTPMISGNGRYVVFTGLIGSAGDCTGPSQSSSHCVYVYDRDADGNGVFDETTVVGGVRTVLVSVNSAGQPAQGGSAVDPWISADGRVVTFRSSATNLGATSPATNTVYAHDRDVAGTGFFDTPGNIATVVASRDAQGNEAGVDYALTPARGSRLGRFLLLAANANLAQPNDSSGFRHLFLRDLCIGAAAPIGCTPTTVRISVRSNGSLPATSLAPVAWFGALSADGQRVAFSQTGGGLVDLNADGQPDEHASREVYFGGTGTGEP